jgi:hypothetical protein
LRAFGEDDKDEVVVEEGVLLKDCLLQVVVKALAICLATMAQSYERIVPPPIVGLYKKVFL